MKRISLMSVLFTITCLLGCAMLPYNEYEDLADREVKTMDSSKKYRIGVTGIVGLVKDDHILVTDVNPDSVADGKIQKGDRIIRLQHRGLGSNIKAMVGKRVYRLGRDWDWHFYITVERDSLRNGKGNEVTFDIRVPPTSGNIYHYGPIGFFARNFPGCMVVDEVQPGSPSEGQLQVGDIILAVNGEPIGEDTYTQFTTAVDRAESREGKGVLKLKIRRGGAYEIPKGQDDKSKAKKKPEIKQGQKNIPDLDIVLKLKVLGSYSPTAPQDCPKTDAIITQTADYLVKNEKARGSLCTGYLGLLATGEKKYIKVVHDFLHKVDWAQPPEDLNDLIGNTNSSRAWFWGYQLILLTEYYLLTGDEFVLPAITRYSRAISAGQDSAGMWGHRMHYPKKNRAFGYGVMNQPTLSCFIGLILADKCGIKDPNLKAAIKRTHDHYDNWIKRGALPYGNHQPVENMFTNNGTSGSLAVAFALLGNKKGADFYGRMSTAASHEILTGHTGPWWNVLWSGLGVNVLGPEVSAAYNNKIHWLRTVTRGWDGQFYGLLGWGANKKPGRLSDTGSYLLNHCAGRRVLHITGKGMDKSLWLTGKEAENAPDAGEIDEEEQTPESLLKLLGHPLPPVRIRAAQLLAIHDADVEDEVMDLLVNGAWEQRIGAIHAIGNLKINSAADELMAIVRDEKEDLWIRELAVKQMAGMEEAKKYGPELLKVLMVDRPHDRFAEVDMAIGRSLESLLGPNPYERNINKELFYKAVAKLLDHKHAWARGAGMNLIKNIPMEDLPKVVDKMVYVIEDQDATYTSYTGSGRQEAMEILYRLGIKESMDYTINTIKEPTGRGGPRVRARTRLLKTFGAEAQYLIPKIKEILGKNAAEIVKNIEESKNPRKMITIEEAKKK